MPSDADYRLRVRLLKAAGIAVWDVLETCHRPGSLDADIAADTLVTNDFGRFLAQHRQIRQVFFNGATAEKFYRQRVLPTLATGAIAYQRLPSTSPAHASLRFEQKRAVWLAALRAAL
jgi:hypoxanthine-DNA glycosylase